MKHVSSFKSFSNVAGILVILIGAIVLTGWLFNIPALKSLFPGLPKMMANTATAFVLAGVTLRLLLDTKLQSKKYKRHIAQSCAIIITIIGILTLSEYIFGTSLGTDQLLFKDLDTPETSHPGRMSPHTAISFTLAGIALLLIETRRVRISQFISLAICFTALLAFTGYAYNIKPLYSISPYIGMSFLTAMAFLLLSLGILSARPDQGFIGIVSGKTTGGFMARSLLPIAIVVPLVVGWLKLKGEQAGLYGTEFGLLLFAILNISILVSVIWLYAGSLNRTDANRKRVEEVLQKEFTFVKLLQDVAVIANETSRIEEALRFTTDCVCACTGWPVGHSYLLAETGELVPTALWHSENHRQFKTFHRVTEVTHFASGVGLPGRVLVSGKPAWIMDVTKDPNFPRAKMANDIGIKAGFAFPVLVESEVVAVLEFFSDKVVEPDKRLLEIMSHIGTQLGRVIERKRAVEALRTSEEKFRSVIETAIEAIILADSSGTIRAWNKGAQTIFGYAEEEVLGKSLTILMPERYRKAHERGIERICSTGESRIIGKTVEVYGLRKNGSEFPIELTVATWKMEEERFFTGVIRDITERKRLEAQILHAQKMEVVGQLAGGVAHDFNNILTTIVGFAQLLQMKMAKDDPLRVNVDQILSSTERAVGLTKSILAFSRKHVIDLKPLNINEVIKDVQKLLPRAIREDIGLKTILTDEDLIVMADHAQMDQVLINLATNARDAMPNGGSLTIKTTRVELDNEFIRAHGYGMPGVYALISVTDTGIGMDEKTKERIFEPFFTTKETGKGTGLGLAIVYGIIKQHSGYTNVYSEVGRGTTFKIYLPIVKSEIEEVKVVQPTPPKRGTETVLVAEDDENIRGLINTVLEEYGYKVIEAVDGEDAIGKFMEHKEKIQLLLLDVIMPKKNGKEVYDEVRKVSPDIKALFMSGYSAEIIQQKEILEEGLNFISKPISPVELLRKVREVLER